MGPEFSELLHKKSPVFKEKGVLSPHYVPETLLYREEELKRLMLAVAPALESKKPSNMFIYGKTGTGKTASSRHVLQKLVEENNAGVSALYMNCRVYDSRYKVLQKTITEFHPDFAKTGYSFAVLYEKLLDWIETSKAKQVVMFLDEVDMVRDLDNLVYTLTRANDDLKQGGLSLIGISNKIGFKQRLDSRARSSLCEEELVFQPYNAIQLAGILRQRCEKAFLPNVVDDSAIELASAIAASDNGDARYALLLLLRAGELAEKRGLQKITDKEVEESRKAADEDKAFEIISTLPEHQKFVLYALASLYGEADYKRLVEEAGEKMFFSGEVYERYVSLAKKFGRDPRTARWYREYVHELEMIGLISTSASGKGIRGHTNLLRLAYDPPRVKKAIEKTVLAED